MSSLSVDTTGGAAAAELCTPPPAPEAESNEGFIPANVIPADCMGGHVFQFLPPVALLNATEGLSPQVLSETCASYPIPGMAVLDQRVWEACFGTKALEAQGLTFDEIPPMNSLGMIRELCKFSQIPVEENAGFTVLTLPRGLTLNKMIALAAAPQAPHQPAVINYIYAPITAQYGDTPVEGGGVVAISNGLLPGSRSRPVAEQRALVEHHGCQMPLVVEAVALLFLTNINSSTTATGPVYLLGRDPWSNTRCIEQIVAQGNPYHLVVGGFAPAGLGVRHDFSDHEILGVVALRKF